MFKTSIEADFHQWAVDDRYDDIKLYHSNQVKEIRDERWVIQDKLTQYKGLVKLFERDLEYSNFEITSSLKQVKVVIKNIQNEIRDLKKKLNYSLNHGRDLVDVGLYENPRLRLAFRHLDTNDVIDCISKSNFDQRKKLDLVRYRRRNKETELQNLILNYDAIERSKNAVGAFPKIQRMCDELSAKVQNAILLQQAAITVNTTYKSIIDIMKDDASSYDHLITMLSCDRWKQAYCIKIGIITGQMGMEFLNDKRIEFQNLQSIINRDKIRRKNDLALQKNKFVEVQKSMRNIIKNQGEMSIITSSNVRTSSHSLESLNLDLTDLSVKLEKLKTNMMLPNATDILPSLQRQVEITEKFKRIEDDCEKKKKYLKELIQHGKIIFDELRHGNHEEISRFEDEEVKMVDMINEQKERYEMYKKKLIEKKDLVYKLRTSLERFSIICDYIDLPVGKDLDILSCLHKKFSYLMIMTESYQKELGENKIAKSQKYIDVMKKNRINLETETEIDEDILEYNDQTIPTRSSIKATGAKIVKEHLEQEWAVIKY